MFQALGRAWQVGKSILHSNDPINYIKGMIDREIMNTARANTLGLSGPARQQWFKNEKAARATSDPAEFRNNPIVHEENMAGMLENPTREITNWDRGRSLFMNSKGEYTPLSKGGAITGTTGGTGIAGSYMMFGD